MCVGKRSNNGKGWYVSFREEMRTHSVSERAYLGFWSASEIIRPKEQITTVIYEKKNCSKNEAVNWLHQGKGLGKQNKEIISPHLF